MKKIILVVMLISFLSCKKDSGTSSTTWHVKYEITSTNPSAKGYFVYRDESGSVLTVGDPMAGYKSIPWSYEANWSKDPGLMMARSLSLAVISVSPSNPNDVTTLKFYVDGKVVNQTTSGMLTYVLTP
jgi:hypothetical protein